MAASPIWKVYSRSGLYVAACVEPEGGAVLMALYGEGSTIRHGHRVVCWTEGKDGEAAASYDECAKQCLRVSRGGPEDDNDIPF